LPLATLILDPDARVLFWNAAGERRFGWTAAEIVSQPYRLVPPEDESAFRDNFARVLNGETLVGLELRRRAKDGRLRDVLGWIAPVRHDDGMIVGVMKVFVEERHLLKRKLLETRKLESLGVLAGGIAHDFNNLLTGILGHASLAEMEVPETSPVRDHLRQIEKSGQRIADLCKQMLAYSGHGRFVVEPFDLNAIVHEVAELLQLSIAKHAALTFRLGGRLPPVVADATQIRQVVMNLVLNASEALGDVPGTIDIATGVRSLTRDELAATVLGPDLPAGDYVYLEIADSGCGMTEKVKARIFDPFFSTKFTGRGLGLSAVLGIVRGHKGALTVESTSGQGATFRVYLPAAASVRATSQSKIVLSPSRKTVLVIDDEDSVRRVAARVLQSLGFEVLEAHDGRESLDSFAARAADVNLVLVDLTMPRLGGEDTVREWRVLRPELPVILMSGFNENEMSERFAGIGVSAFLQKPFTLNDMTVKVQGVLTSP
jgi:PAS domain S-box-containing protein